MKFPQILILYLARLKNAGHYEFIHSIVEFALNCIGVTTKLTKWFAPLQAAIAEEERVLKISLKNVISEQILKLDGQRDGLVSSIKGAVNAELKSLDAEISLAAQYVWNELVSLKVDIQDNYMNQSGQIDLLVAVLLDAQRENVEKLGLLPLVQELKSVNDLMHTLMNQRDEEQKDRMNDGMAKAREATDHAYNNFIRAVDSYTYINEDQLQEDDLGFGKFINDSNMRVEYFRRYVLKLTQLPETEVPGGGAVDGTTPPAEETPGQQPEQTPEQNPGNENENVDNDENTDNTNPGGGNNGNYPPGYDPDADDDPGV